MQTVHILTFLTILFTVRPGCCANFFGYSLVDQLAWSTNFPECGGKRQSPIELKRIKSTPSNNSPLVLNGYADKLPPLKLTNTGHTVSLSIDPHAIKSGARIPSITGAILAYEYEFESLHLHWGRGNAFGSEHIIGRLTTPLELHIVHKRIGNSIERAPRQWNQYAVLAVLYSYKKKSGKELEPILSHLSDIQEFNTSIPLKGSFSLGSFLGGIDTNKFYQYEGSLTTPPCTESVSWFVFRDLLSCTASQLRQLRRLKTLDRYGNPTRLLENHRNTQSLNNRTVNFYAGKQRSWHFI